MDKEKQIEEMESKLNELFIPHIGYTNDFMRLEIAQELLKYYQPKINENEVVISKEEKQKLLKEMYEQGKFDAIADLEKEEKVVIGKEEYETLKKFENKVRRGVCFTQKEWFDYANKDSNERTSLLIEAKEKARKEMAKEFYSLCCGHGTTYIKKYLREHYDFEIGD